MFDVVNIGFHCRAFSVPSNGKYGIQEFLCGRRDVSEDVASTIEAHNTLAAWTLRSFQLCLGIGICCSIENPWSSLFWKWPEVEQLSAM